MKKNTSPTLVMSVMILTLSGPFLYNFAREDFEFLKFLTDVSIPCWLIIFSISWLYHKNALNKSEKGKNYYNSRPSPPHAAQAKQLSQLQNEAEIRFNNSKASIASLENATLIAGLIAGFISILAHFISKD